MKRFRFLTVIFALLLTGCGETNTQKIDELVAAQEQSQASSLPPKPTVAVPDASNGKYDVDLTGLESNMVYAQVYDMVFGETDYEGKTVRAKGTFDCYEDPRTNQRYYAVLISDAAACCAQGLEFVLSGEHQYPDDYPEIGAEIVIHGTFHSYEDATGAYVQLNDAALEA